MTVSAATWYPRAAFTQDALVRLDRLARLMDSAFVVPGTGIRLGADALLNVLPGVGPLATNAVSAYLLIEARRLGAPASLLARMAGNLGLDFLIGLVPGLGWVADVFFRANQRNIALLKAHLEAGRATRRQWPARFDRTAEDVPFVEIRRGTS